jgi:hypothetical protein
MAERRKVMNAKEMEQWLLKKGAVPVDKEIKAKPWYKRVCKLPSCMTQEAEVEERHAR